MRKRHFRELCHAFCYVLLIVAKTVSGRLAEVDVRSPQIYNAEVVWWCKTSDIFCFSSGCGSRSISEIAAAKDPLALGMLATMAHLQKRFLSKTQTNIFSSVSHLITF